MKKEVWRFVLFGVLIVFGVAVVSLIVLEKNDIYFSPVREAIGELSSVREDVQGEAHLPNYARVDSVEEIQDVNGKEIIVKFKEGVDEEAALTVLQQSGLEVVKRIEQIGLIVLKIDRGGRNDEEFKKLINEKAGFFFNNPNVKFVEKNGIWEITNVPNDNLLGLQWNLEKINLFGAWDITTGNVNEVIVIGDTGIDTDHEDLAGKFISGWNYAEDNDNIEDVHGHGTSVAGVAGAVTNNVVGIAGGAWENKLYIDKLSVDGPANMSLIVDSIVDAADLGYRVYSLSFFPTEEPFITPSMIEAGNYFRNNGGVVITSVGNNGMFIDELGVPSIIHVGATDIDDNLAPYSNWGPYIDLVSPGGDFPDGIWTTDLSEFGYGEVQGTSFAVPLVAGVVGLIFSANPDLTPEQVVQILEDTAVDLGDPGFDNEFGWGRIDASAAVQMAISCSNECPGLGFSMCAGTSALNVCVNDYDEDLCLEWGNPVFCSNGEICDEDLAECVSCGGVGELCCNGLCDEGYNCLGDLCVPFCADGHVDNGDGTCTAEFPVHVGDGVVFKNDLGWSEIRESLSGDSLEVSGDWIILQNRHIPQNDYSRIHRVSIPFSTFSLPDSADVLNAELELKHGTIVNSHHDSFDYISLVEADLENVPFLSLEDYDKFGSLNNPVKGAEDIDVSEDLNDPLGWITVILNEYGKSWIDKQGWTTFGLRVGYDVEDYYVPDEITDLEVHIRESNPVYGPKLRVDYRKPCLEECSENEEGGVRCAEGSLLTDPFGMEVCMSNSVCATGFGWEYILCPEPDVSGGAGNQIMCLTDPSVVVPTCDSGVYPYCLCEPCINCEQVSETCESLGYECGEVNGYPCGNPQTGDGCQEGEMCESGQCIPEGCVNECYLSGGVKRCAGSGGFEICDDYDGDGCAEWGGYTGCTAGTYCEDSDGSEGVLCEYTPSPDHCYEWQGDIECDPGFTECSPPIDGTVCEAGDQDCLCEPGVECSCVGQGLECGTHTVCGDVFVDCGGCSEGLGCHVSGVCCDSVEECYQGDVWLWNHCTTFDEPLWVVDDCDNNEVCIDGTSECSTACTDTDGGDEPLEQGTMTVFYDDGNSEVFQDFCSGNQVVEYYCTPDGNGDSNFVDCSDFGNPGLGNYECINGECVAVCTFDEAYWSKSVTAEGQTVTLTVEANFACIDEIVDFEIFEDDVIFDDPADINPGSVAFESLPPIYTKAVATWVAEYPDDGVGDPEFYFVGTLVSNSGESIQSDLMTVVAPGCGNDVVETNLGEICDDGVDNGVVCSPEYMDSCYYCDLECQGVEVEGGYCGDGIFDEGFEECDNGVGNSDIEPDACRTNCLLPICGDSVADSGEECDDGNQNEIDCTNECAVPFCGDGACNGNEEEVPCSGNEESWTCLEDCGQQTVGCSFLAGTKVTMGDRSLKNIEEVEIGEMVLGYDERNGEIRESKVADLLVHDVNGYYVINGKLRVTGTNPIYVNGEWNKPPEIEIGDLLMNSYRSEERVKSLEFVRSGVRVYTLSVFDTHNFFTDGILAHNKAINPCVCTGPRGCTPKECLRPECSNAPGCSSPAGVVGGGGT